MTLATRPCCRRLRSLMVGLALLSAPRASAQDQGPSGKPIDLVFLVDVSQSMITNPGNDPQRIRWDAILLSMDLLTSEDRVLIIPFNGEAPAKFVDGNNVVHQEISVPGKLSEKLINPRSDEGRSDQSKVKSFVHGWQQDAFKEGAFDGDNGGTGILYALEQARDKLGRPAADRRQYIILLTDGYEASSSKPRGLERLAEEINPVQSPKEYSAAMRADPRFQRWLEAYAKSIKVYTIGLGTEVDVELLTLIASKSGGHFEYLHYNGELIDYFRTLIWQLKGCWTKERSIAETRSPEEDRMWRIQDFGAVYYKVVKPQQGDPRTYFALGPDEALTFAWVAEDGRPLNGVKPLHHAAETSYTYDYFDRNGLDGGDRFLSSWSPANSDRRILFSKRTDRPLFTITEPGKVTFQRYELVPIKVRMDMDLGFKPEQFVLSVELRKTGDDKRNPRLLGPMELNFDPRKVGEFRLDLDLSDLPPSGAETDGYTLAITAKGRGRGKDVPLDKRDSLSDYTLELLPIDIRVENRLTLRDVGLVTLNSEGGLEQAPIKIRPVTPIRVSRNMKPIALKLQQTWLIEGKQREYEFVTVTQPVTLHYAKVTDPAVLGSDEAGELEGEILTTIPKELGNKRLEKGTYKGGVLVLSDATSVPPRVVPLSIPFQVVIAAVKVRFDRSPIVIRSKSEGRAAAEPIQVLIKSKGGTLDDSQAVTISIPPKTFDVKELWLETLENPGPKTQSLKLPRASDKFRVVFEPSENLINNQIGKGYYTFPLGLDVKPEEIDYDPAEGKVELFYNAPDLVLDRLDPVRIQPGAEGYRELKVGLKGGGGKRPVSLQFLGQDAKPDRPAFRFRGGLTKGIGLAPDGRVDSTPGPEPRWTPLGINVKVPPNLACGEYTLENGWLTAELTEPRKVEIKVIVNDLEIEDARGRALKGQDRLLFYQIRKVPEGDELVQKIRVFAVDGNLGENEVDVSDEGPFLNLDKHQRSDLRLKKPLPKRAYRREKDGKTGVEIDLCFSGEQPVFEKHSGNLVIRCRERELKKELPCVVEWVQVLGPGPGKPVAGKPARP